MCGMMITIVLIKEGRCEDLIISFIFPMSCSNEARRHPTQTVADSYKKAETDRVNYEYICIVRDQSASDG